MDAAHARRQAAEALARAGIEDADLEAEVLLRHALGGVDRAAFFAHIDDSLAADVGAAYDTLVARRLALEPTAYITGHREFYGLELRTTPAALIPRPETELLVEATLARLRDVRAVGAHGRAPLPPLVVDVGAGGGAIAIAVAANHPAVRVVATDVSAEALALTVENARMYALEGRIALVQTDLLAALCAPRRSARLCAPTDVIVANPPYVKTDDWRRLAPEIREHEPQLALDGGPDGLAVVRRLLSQAAPFVAAGAALYVEIGDDEGAEALAAARAVMPPEARVEVRPDLAGRDRMLAVEPA